MLRPDPDQLSRFKEIHHNLLARIAEAEREGWLGEIEGLHISLAGVRDKIGQLNTQNRNTDLGMPGYRDIAGRNSTTP